MAGALKRVSNGGFTLVELLVTLAMSALLIGAMYVLFGDQQKVYATQEQIIQMQQNARVAMEMISRDVRMAGYFGCAPQGSFTNTVNGYTTNFLLNLAAVKGLDNVVGNSVSLTSPYNPFGAKQGSDVLALCHADANNPNPVDAPYMGKTSADIHLDNAGTLIPGDIVVVSDCTYTSVFQITKLTTSSTVPGRSVVHNTGVSGVAPGNSTKDLGHEYKAGSQVYKMEQKYYWLSPGGDLKEATGTFVGGSWSPSNQEVTVAEHIQDLQFEYGVDQDADGTPDKWLNATQVGGNWNKVVAVRIYILARTAKTEKGYTNRSTYSSTDGSLTYGPYNDGYHRYFLEREVAIRNRWAK